MAPATKSTWTGDSGTSQLQMYAMSDVQLLKPQGDTDTTIAMTADEAYDPSGVEYYFTETSGNLGGSDSGWQDSPFYVDTGLSPGKQYTYTVTVRDKSPNQNTTAPSAAVSATTTGESFSRYDFTGDGRIDVGDLSVLGSHWLGPRAALYNEATLPGTVNLEDLAGLAAVWREGD